MFTAMPTGTGMHSFTKCKNPDKYGNNVCPSMSLVRQMHNPETNRGTMYADHVTCVPLVCRRCPWACHHCCDQVIELFPPPFRVSHTVPPSRHAVPPNVSQQRCIRAARPKGWKGSRQACTAGACQQANYQGGATRKFLEGEGNHILWCCHCQAPYQQRRTRVVRLFTPPPLPGAGWAAS